MDKLQYKKKRLLLSQKLVYAREKAGLSQKAVEQSGIITQSELSKIENGIRKVDFVLLDELAKLYKIELKFFQLDGKL